MDVRAISLENLATHLHPTGGWGYAPGGAPQVEPTAFALLALSVDRTRFAETIERGLATLRSWQQADGSFRVQNGHDESVWPTALALYTFAALNDADLEAQRRAAAWLLAYEPGDIPDKDEYRENFDIDPDLRGWSWTTHTFSWSEPTAWSVLALSRAGLGAHPRVLEGRRMLLDRTFESGGINCGNRRVFGRSTAPVPAVSALLLLTFAGGPEHSRLEATREYLRTVVKDEEDLENLCWIRLALSVDARAGDLAWLDERIARAYESRKDTQLFPASTLREALTALALSANASNPLLPKQAVSTWQVPDGPPHASRGLSFGQKLQSMVRGMAVKALGHLRAVPADTRVHIADAADYNGDLAAVLRAQFNDFRAKVPLKDKRVVLKPNLVEYHRDKVINTNPHVIAAAIELCRSEGAREVVVADGPGHWRNVEYLVTASGLGDVLRHYKVPFIDLNHDAFVKMPNLGRLTKLEYLYLAESIASADVLISMPKLKTHHWEGVTLSLKNLFGALPGTCYGWPKNVLHWRGIENSIVDIALTRTPDLAIVDGIVGMEGDGPLNGTPVTTGVLVMGTDLLAVDATCCRVMELNPAKVGHLSLGEFKRLGLLQESKILQVGQTIEQVSQPFEVLKHFNALCAHRREAQPA